MRIGLSRCITLALFAVSAGLSCPVWGKAQCKAVVIAGRVEGSDSFEKKIGAGLSFKIHRAYAVDEAGWVYEIGRSHPAGGVEYNYIDLTPPYHFGDAAYIGPGWGSRAQDVATPRAWTFWFFASPEQEVAAQEALSNLIHPSQEHPDSDASARAIDRFDIGKGRFRIVSSRLRPGTVPRDEPSDDGDWGAVLGLSFSVQLVLPAHFQFAEGLEPVPAGCPGMGEWRR